MSGLFSAIGRGVSAAGYAAGDTFAKSGLMDQQSDLELNRQQRLLEFKADLDQRTADKARVDQNQRIAGRAGEIADTAVAGKRGLIDANIADPGAWTPEQQAAVDQSLALDRKAVASDPDVKLRAAADTGDLNFKEQAMLEREDRKLSQADRNAARKEAMDLEREDRRDARSSEAENRRDARQTAALNAAEERWRRAGAGDKVPSGYRMAKDGQSLEFIPGGPADPNTKPAGGKPLNDTQAKSLLFGARMQSANEILDDLEKKGKVFSTPGADVGFGVGSAMNVVNTKEGQMLDQAKRDFLNAVLRRESGAAISDGEFVSGNKQYFPAAGDGSGVIDQKRKNREIATRGILAEVPDAEARVKQVRGGDSPAKKDAAGGGSDGWSIRLVPTK